MSKLLQERWHRIAFKQRNLSEGWGDNHDERLKPLEEHGFYFAGASTVVLGDLDEMSGKEYRHNYPYDEYMGQGPFHVQVSVEDDGTFRIHNYSEVEDAYCTGSMPKKGTRYSSIDEVIADLQEMVKCYDEWMDAYCQIRDAGGTINVDEPYVPAYINPDHPEAQRLRKK